MLKLIKELFSLLTPNQRRQFYILQILVVLMALAEIVAVTSIGPFMAIVGDISLLERDNFIARAYQALGFVEPMDFLFVAGLLVLLVMTLSAILSTYTIWKVSLFANKVGTEIADRLYNYYMQQNWLFHTSGSSAKMTKEISVEANRVTNGIIQPLMQMNARVLVALFISLGIFIYNPLVAIIGLIIFTSAYIILFKIVRSRLEKNGINISETSTKRFRLMNEGFGGIKDILLLGRKYNFINRFQNQGEILAYSQGTNIALNQVPRYFIELLAFGSIIALVLVLIKTHQGNIGAVFPILAVYALAGFKLLPAFQRIYSSMTQIKGNISAFESIKQDLIVSKSMDHETLTDYGKEHLELENNITLKNVTFTYPGKNTPVLKNLNLTIESNKVIGIVGPSGSGKSTVIDIILGLIEPQKGQLLIDNEPITEVNCRAWQNTIGFVPQAIFLTEGSISENVAFGIPEQEINLKQVEKAINMAHLDEFVVQLPNGLLTKVGERGVQLSGGQRQRIGIARALYHEANILVFDEATSALDGITEKLIMDAIHDFGGQKTIIMIAHRLKTVKKCDTIFYIENGQITDQGTYQDLIKINPQFKRMAAHA